MPMFEFECKNCRNKFEELIRDQKKIRCPRCDSFDLIKLISASGAISDQAKCHWDDPSLPNKQEFQRKR
ncbi:zinc ribbon domain-containing protein [bacterium]|nr:zinc ribbon domain-containing protein [bacterium]